MVLSDAAATLGAGAIGAFGSLFSSGLNSAIGAANTRKQYKYAKKLMQKQYELERQARQTAFGDTRHSLEDAGYNPMLALGQQANSLTPSATAPGGQMGNVDIADSVNSAVALRNQIKRDETLNRVDTQNAENNAELTLQQGALFKAQTDGQLIRNNIEQLTGLTKAEQEIDNMRAHSAYERQQIKNLKQDIIESGSRITKNIAQATEAYTGAGLNSANTAVAKEDAYTKRLYNLDEQEFRDYLEQHPNQRNIRYFGRATGFTAGDAVKTGGAVAGAYAIKGKSPRKVSAKSGRR